MALINCSECGKEISDKASACPYCGCPIEKSAVEERKTDEVKEAEIDSETLDSFSGNIEKKKTMSKKAKAIKGAVLGVVIIGGISAYFLTGDVRLYNSAQKNVEVKQYEVAAGQFQELGEYKDAKVQYQKCIFEQASGLYSSDEFDESIELLSLIPEYEEAQKLINASKYSIAQNYYIDEEFDKALEIYKEIESYKDSEKYAKDCEYQLSVDGKFMKALAKGLMLRWDESEGGAPEAAGEYREHIKKLIHYELDGVKDYQNQQFQDENLGKAANDYIEALNGQLEANNYYAVDDMKYANQWTEAYNNRSLLIKKFVEQFDLKVNKEYDTILNEFILTAGVVTEEKNIKEQVYRMLDAGFELTQSSYGMNTYETTIENITNVTFSYLGIVVNLYDKDNVLIESCYTNQIQNLIPGQKAKLSFMTQKSDFSKMDYTINYTIE